jgi:hypothetical protein
VLSLNLRSYTDEGGHEDDPGRNYLAMAGYVATAGSWELFTEQWLDTLDKAGLKLPFSMKKCAHFRGEFGGWTEPERKQLVGRLLEIIRETKGTPIGAVVSLKDYWSMTAAQQEFLREPFFVVFQFITRMAAIMATDEPPDERVAMFYAYNSEYGVTFGGRAEQLWHKIREEFEDGNRMGAYTSLPMTLENAPLQAADVFAYELTKDFENMVKRPSDPMRFPLTQIIRMFKIPKPMVRFFDRAELLRIVQGNQDKCADQTGVEELPANASEVAKAKMIDWLNIRGGYKSEWPQ